MAKHYTYYFFSVTTLFSFSCNQEDITEPNNEVYMSKNMIPSDTLHMPNESDTFYTSQSTSYVSLIVIEMEITNPFTQQLIATTNWTTQQYINKLDSIANLTESFETIKPATYVTLTAQEADSFLHNYDISYNQLNVSATVKAYMDQLLQYRKLKDLITLYENIQNDPTLTLSEKQLLTYLVDSLSKNTMGQGDNPIWRKRKICAITIGWQDSTAQAVFNAALVNVYNE